MMPGVDVLSLKTMWPLSCRGSTEHYYGHRDHGLLRRVVAHHFPPAGAVSDATSPRKWRPKVSGGLAKAPPVSSQSGGLCSEPGPLKVPRPLVRSSGFRGRGAPRGAGTLLGCRVTSPHGGAPSYQLLAVNDIFLSAWWGKDWGSGWTTEETSWLSREASGRFQPKSSAAGLHSPRVLSISHRSG